MTKVLGRNPAYLIPGDMVDGWRVVERLGSGGYGAVYVVEKEGRRCAMKFSLRRPVSEDLARTDARLFQRELVILAQLAHLSNVVRLHACGRYPDPLEGHFYIVMDCVEGNTLSAWAERHNPTPREVARLFARLAVVLDEAHRLCIFHRDLKPENILVRSKDAEPVLLDFGAGDFSMARPLTEGPLPPGTPHYRSPESLRFLREHRNNPDARYEFKASDDLYSLGVCLYEALTAQDPFQPSQERPRLNMEIEVRVPPAPHEVNPRVPAALGDVVRRLMSKSPHERHPTGEALRRELAELTAQEDAAWDKPLHPPTVPKEPLPGAAVEPSTRPLTPPTPPRRSRWPRAAALLGAAALASVVIALVRGGASTPPVQSTQESAAPAVAPTPTVQTDVTTPPTPAMAPGEESGPTLFAAAQKEGPTVKTSDTAKSPSPSPVPGKKAPSTSDFLKRCALSFGTAAWLELGCSGAQVRPEPGNCPKGAVEAMTELEMYEGNGIAVWLDVGQVEPPYEPLWGVYRSGSIVSRVSRSEGKMPKGTLLYGQLWMNEKERVAYGRWTEAELPDGKKVPVCLILASSRGDGYRWMEGSAPGAVRLPKHVPFEIAHRWP